MTWMWERTVEEDSTRPVSHYSGAAEGLKS